MSRAGDPTFAGEFDVVGVAVGTALVSGGLAVVGPSLAALTGALAALAWTGWISLVRRRALPIVPLLRGAARWSVVSSSAGLLVFLFGPTELDPFRALVLAVSLLPLWTVARRTPLGGA